MFRFTFGVVFEKKKHVLFADKTTYGDDTQWLLIVWAANLSPNMVELSFDPSEKKHNYTLQIDREQILEDEVS